MFLADALAANGKFHEAEEECLKAMALRDKQRKEAEEVWNRRMDTERKSGKQRPDALKRLESMRREVESRRRDKTDYLRESLERFRKKVAPPPSHRY